MSDFAMQPIDEIWSKAAAFDPTLRIRPGNLAALRRKRITAEPYSRNRLFDRMAAGQAAVFSGFGVPIAQRKGATKREALLKLIRSSFRSNERISVQAGPSRRRTRVTVPDLLNRWDGGRAVVSVTDLHIRDTKLEQRLGIKPLSDFNLLIRGTEEMAVQEMMTLVVSSEGNVTDSHSDDPDGSNHAFLGTKLWLAWDTYEGRVRGLEDVEIDTVEKRAAFDMNTFLSVPSARWFLVGEGDTLFLPGKMTHKVITLEHYIGVGSFYVALPSALETLERWYTRGPLWEHADTDGSTADVLDSIAMQATRQVKALRHGTAMKQEQWGLRYLESAVMEWDRCTPAVKKRRLLEHPAFAQLVGEVMGLPDSRDKTIRVELSLARSLARNERYHA